MPATANNEVTVVNARKRVPRTRGVLCGFLLVLLGAWAGLAPFIGPYFNFAYTPDTNWTYTSGRLWLEILPGAGAFLGGLIVMSSVHRVFAMFGGCLASLAGAWLVVGPPLSGMYSIPHVGTPVGTHKRQVLETLGFFTGLGVLIVFLAAVALGRFAVIGIREVEEAEEEAEAEERWSRLEGYGTDDIAGLGPADSDADDSEDDGVEWPTRLASTSSTGAGGASAESTSAGLAGAGLSGAGSTAAGLAGTGLSGAGSTAAGLAGAGLAGAGKTGTGRTGGGPTGGRYGGAGFTGAGNRGGDPAGGGITSTGSADAGSTGLGPTGVAPTGFGLTGAGRGGTGGNGIGRSGAGIPGAGLSGGNPAGPRPSGGNRDFGTTARPDDSWSTSGGLPAPRPSTMDSGPDATGRMPVPRLDATWPGTGRERYQPTPPSNPQPPVSPDAWALQHDYPAADRDFGTNEPPYRADHDFGATESPYQADRDFGANEPPYRSDRDFGANEPSYQADRDFGATEPSYRATTNTGIDRGRPAADDMDDATMVSPSLGSASPSSLPRPRRWAGSVTIRQPAASSDKGIDNSADEHDAFIEELRRHHASRAGESPYEG